MKTPVWFITIFLRTKSLRNEMKDFSFERAHERSITCIYTKTDDFVGNIVEYFKRKILAVVFGSHSGLGANVNCIISHS
jgi:hypothetical protein